MLLVLGLAGVAVTPALAAAADDGSVPVASWGQPCPTPGAEGVAQSGKKLVCEQRPRDRCPVWHDPAPERPGSGWVRPSTSPCPVCTPSASTSSSTHPSIGPSTHPSTAAASVVSSTPGPGLPVTGSSAGWLAGLGAALVAAGAALVWPRRRRPRLPAA